MVLGARSAWPSDVQQWPAGPDRAACGGEGPSEERAAKRSARRRREAPKIKNPSLSKIKKGSSSKTISLRSDK